MRAVIWMKEESECFEFLVGGVFRYGYAYGYGYGDLPSLYFPASSSTSWGDWEKTVGEEVGEEGGKKGKI
jgi:hypothetical protein